MKKGVEDGKLVKTKNSYKLSNEEKKVKKVAPVPATATVKKVVKAKTVEVKSTKVKKTVKKATGAKKAVAKKPIAKKVYGQPL